MRYEHPNEKWRRVYGRRPTLLDKYFPIETQKPESAVAVILQMVVLFGAGVAVVILAWALSGPGQ